MATVIDGKAVAQTIRSEIADEVRILSEKYGKVSNPIIPSSSSLAIYSPLPISREILIIIIIFRLLDLQW
jgi:hypothetical protein